ncbi:hypothetical protein B2J88_42535 [Rhodococcus sp. SRB_17]|nr:hypothetical protein [Rhodococcus sp. SRB_17]
MSENLSEVEARLACADLVAAFCNHVDSGNASKNADLFADDGVLTLPTMELSGNMIRVAMEKREAKSNRKTCHHTSNFQFLGLEGSTARAVSTVVLYALDRSSGPLTPEAILRNEDNFVKVDDGRWLFTHRHTTNVWPCS